MTETVFAMRLNELGLCDLADCNVELGLCEVDD